MTATASSPGTSQAWAMDVFLQNDAWLSWAVQDFRFQVEAFKTAVSFPLAPLGPLQASPPGTDIDSDSNHEQGDSESRPPSG